MISEKDSLVSLVQPFIGYTFSHFRYTDFKSTDASGNTFDYGGKKVVGVPEHAVNAGVDLGLRWGLYAYATYQYFDSIALTYDNTQQAKSYSLLGAKLGYRTDLSSHFRLDVFAGGNNLLSSLYYTMVFLNAAPGPGGSQPAVYLPGPYTPTFYGGVSSPSGWCCCSAAVSGTRIAKSTRSGSSAFRNNTAKFCLLWARIAIWWR